MELKKKWKCFGGWTEVYTHSSRETKTDMSFSVIRPESGNVDSLSPAIIWLSGLTCTEENFIQKAGAQRYANEFGTFVFCPDTSPRGLDLPSEHDSWDFGSGAGFYVDATEEPWSKNYRMYSYVVEELYSLITEKFPIDKKKIAISGHSMGGHGALTIALKNPDKFCAVSAFSPIVNPMNCPWGVKAFTHYLGAEKTAWKEYDSCELIRQNGSDLPLLVFQGEEDEFLQEQLLTNNLVEVCKEQAVDLDLKMCPGHDHSYYFISSFIQSIF